MTDAGSTPKALIASARPLFILGSARSGTTFLTRLLSSHPEVMVTNETALFLLLHDIAKKSGRGVASGLNYSKEHGSLIARWVDDGFRRTIESVYECIAQQERRECLKYWGEKHPHIFPVLDRITEQFPDARYVYLVRDPRRVIASLAVMTGSAIEPALENWKIFTNAYERFAAEMAPESLLTVRYEDIVAAPVEWMERIFTWLGVDHRPPQLLDAVERWVRSDAHNGAQLDPDARRTAGEARGTVTADADVREATDEFCAKYAYSGSVEALQ